MYEISHRFIPSINEEIDALYGIDGPAQIRFAIAYGITGDLMATFGRSSNIDRSKGDFDNFQFFGQLIYNTMLFDKKLGVGIIPSYLYNSFIYSVEKQYSFTIGTYFQYYFNRVWSLWIEYNAIVAGYQGRIRLDEIGKSYNSLSFGFVIETGGHIFNFMLTNNVRLNAIQYLVGAYRSASDNEWRIGFGILRYF